MTEKSEPTFLDDMNTRRIIENIRKHVSEVVNASAMFSPRPQFSKDLDTKQTAYNVCKAIEDYLGDLERKNIVSKASVSRPAFEWMTWSKLYPKWKDRIIAILMLALRIETQSSTRKWYHSILPYRVRSYITVNASFFDKSVPKEDVEQHLSEYYHAELIHPYLRYTQHISITPIMAVSEIKISATVGKEL